MKKHYFLIFALILLTITASGCTGRRVTTAGWPGITVDQDVAYLASGPHIYAVNLDNGTLKWRFPAEAQRGMDFYAPPAVLDDQQLIAAGYDDTLYSINPANGKENWSFTGPKDRLISQPLVTETAIYFTSADHNLYAVDHQGNELWAPFETEEPIWAAPVWSESCECVFVTSMDHRVYAVDPDRGTEIWRTEDLGGPIVSKPAISDDGILYVSTFANEVLAINVDTRAVKWRFTTDDWSWASPIIDGDQVYASDLAGNFYAIDRQSGEQLWVVKPAGRIVSAPLVGEDMIYFGTDDGALITITPDGTIQRNQQISGKLYTSPVGGEDLILIAPTEHDELLLAYDQNGTKVWNFSPSDD
ncbi:MAG: PQQ-binding-like beta-propeller repeat protein [Anaerolineales bacterium]|nr:PQQ-binding-like beta-propeller repeat protein [Anaerolineales bacterium]